MNTYPLYMSQKMLFLSKESSLKSSVDTVASALSGLSELTEENVDAALSLVEITGVSRAIVTTAAGRVLYDTREVGSAAGYHVFYTELVQALEGYDAFYSVYKDGAFRSTAAAPVVYRSETIGAVYVYEYDRSQAELLQNLQKNLMSISVGIGAVVLTLSILLSKLLTGRIEDLLTAMRGVREGSYNHRADVGGHDEIAQIADEFNDLTGRLQVTEDARRRFVSDASHELKTPLSTIRLLSDSILQAENMDDDMVREFVMDIGQEAERLSSITEDLLRLTRLDSGLEEEAQAVEAAPIIERVCHSLRLLAGEKRVSVEVQIETPCHVRITKGELHQVVYNLVENAIKYNHENGFVHVSLSAGTDHAFLTVEDDGIGIPEEDLSHIFERFYRVDKARSRAAGGTGLGLAIVRDTVRRRGGSVEARLRSGGGTVFTICLMREEAEAP
ncbi:MAG: HAMP domain-containing histidine kinase [Oscillospiraceae bacterium]|jgi:signal transduction histidine kinase|nr:HAMP domain-containing histidine kinase [Oscillospiraceae bacterium]